MRYKRMFGVQNSLQIIKQYIIVCNLVFFCNSGKLLFVPYTKDFGRITQFWGNDLATVLYATFCSDMLSSHSFSKQR